MIKHATTFLFYSCMIANVAAAQVVLDDSGYWRSYYRFMPDRICPEAMRESGETLLGRRFATIQRGIVERMEAAGIDHEAEDWHEHILLGYGSSEGWGSYFPMTHFMPPPPDDWMQPEFDDQDWPRRRSPMQMGEQQAAPLTRQAFFRTRFTVSQPHNARYSIDLIYRGGVRVFVNGVELARLDLPTGELDENAVATPYPAQAYIAETLEDTNSLPRNTTHIRDMTARHGSPGAVYFGGRQHYEVGELDDEIWKRTYDLRERRAENIRISPELLREGVNVLAVEVRAAAAHPVVMLHGARYTWPHARLSRFSLKTDSPDAVSNLQPRPGVSAIALDPHTRVYSLDFIEPGAPTGTVRITGAPNGVYSGQIAVQSDRTRHGLRIMTGELEQIGGQARVPAENIEILSIHGTDLGSPPVRSHMPNERDLALQRYRPLLHRNGSNWSDATQQAEAMLRFTGISSGIRQSLEPGIQSFWLMVNIPANTTPGEYRGSVTISVEGADDIDVPIELEVVEWPMPEPHRFRTIVAIDQSPYGVAARFQLEPWSEKHWAAIDESFRLLGRAASRWINIPVIQHSELGNDSDAMIKWIRSPDGSITYDFSLVERYLDTALKHLPMPAVINFVVAGDRPYAATVPLFDKYGNSLEPLTVAGESLSRSERRAIWEPFAIELYNFLRSRDLAHAMHWGSSADDEGDIDLKLLLHSIMPDVGWTRSGHTWGPDAHYRANWPATYTNFIRMASPVDGLYSAMGWSQQRPPILLVSPRRESRVFDLLGNPFSWRLLPYRANVAGHHGIGRIGSDYWGRHAHASRTGNAHVGGPVNGSILQIGSQSAIPTGDFEMLIEGLQEVELCAYLEAALLYEKISGELADTVRDTLNLSLSETSVIPAVVSHMGPYNQLADYGLNWRERSRRLHRTAALVARITGRDIYPPDDPEEEATTLALAGRPPVLHVAPGASDTFRMQIINNSRADLEWQAGRKEPWVSLEPQNGILPAGHRRIVSLSVMPQQEDDTRIETILTLIDPAGRTLLDVPLVVYVEEHGYQPPEGPAIMLANRLDWIISHSAISGLRTGVRAAQTRIDGANIPALNVAHKGGGRMDEIVFNIEGRGVNTFAVEVRNADPANAIFRFQVAVDGIIRADSGHITPGSPTKTLIVRNLAEAAELSMLVVAVEGHIQSSHQVTNAWWDRPRFFFDR